MNPPLFCRLLGHDLWNGRCTRARCGHVRPFHVGRIYAPDERPGPYPTGNCDRSQLAALGAQLAAHRRSAPSAQQETP